MGSFIICYVYFYCDGSKKLFCQIGHDFFLLYISIFNCLSR
ncbi:unnamed protein product [Spirodela intermedia]|uniref:Uncharacterized protein n=1 Tax=Spirodela intermedia TaxID=51605 RepID=A0A7I8KV84_SPIIN|nr:unnamed protein product [Spirodela intermedia]